ncbi:MAG TPA: GNAT family N-acetyltransferase [Smithellaceae bacterium]|nr:GNAT family N-acetyltransferase [Smithellaceae bacterium]
MTLKIRSMTRKEVDLAIEWAAQEGWNPGLHDAECFYAADPHGFFLAEQDGEPVGCVSAVLYNKQFCFAGFYMVRKTLRGQGIGHELAKKVFDYAGGRCIGNDAVVAQQETYRQLGFHLAYRNVRYCGTAGSDSDACPEIVLLQEVPLSEVMAYDRKMFSANREAFLKCWISRPQSTALGYIADGRLSGYGVIRQCRKGYKIGPLFADHEDIAEKLFQALTGSISGQEFYLDIPEPNAAAGLLVRRHHLQSVFETARMYSGAAPVAPLENIFGVTSFELG